MSENRFIDPRLVAKEGLFQELHQVNFEILAHINAIQQVVMQSQRDISKDNENWQAIHAIFDTHLADITELPQEVEALVSKSRKYVNRDAGVATAHKAQVIACAAQALTYWRILGEVPDDLMEIEEVTATTKKQFMTHLSMWHKFFHDDGVLH
jgi:hypothetical protein